MHRIRKYTTPKGDGNLKCLTDELKNVIQSIRKYTTPKGDGNSTTSSSSNILGLSIIRKYTTPKGDGNLAYCVAFLCCLINS